MRSALDAMRLGVEAALVGRELVPGDVEVVDGRDRARRPLVRERPRGSPCPGFVDLQVNGFGGVDFLDADAAGYRRRGRGAARDRRHGATCRRSSPRPRSSSSRRWRRCRRRRAARASSASTSKGPFLAPSRLGTHPAVGAPRSRPRAARAPARGRAGAAHDARARAARRRRADRPAPARAASPSPAATPTRTREEANAAFDLGVRTVTHLFNAMRPFKHRDPGIAGVALARDDVIVQVILDGIHLAPDTAQLVWQRGGGPRRARHRRDGRRRRRRRLVQPRRARGRGPRRRRPRARRRARRQRR